MEEAAVQEKASYRPPAAPLSLNGLASAAHKINVKNGFYEEPRELGTRIALIHSEVSEMLQADRKLRYCAHPQVAKEILEIEDDETFKRAYESQIKDKFEQEAAGTIIRVLDVAAYLKIDIHHYVLAELRYNSLRGHKHGAQY